MQNSFKEALNSSLLTQKDLSIARFLFYILIFIFFLNKNFNSYAHLPEAFYEPVFILQFLSAPSPSHFPHFELFVLFWRATLITSALGLFSSVSKWTSFVGGFYLLSLDTSYGFDHHRYYILVILMGLLCLFNLSQHYSIDKFLFNNNESFPPQPNPTILLKLAFCMMYFSAGFTKLKMTGFDYFTEDTMKEFMIIAKNIYAPYRHHEIEFFENIRLFVLQNHFAPKIIAFLGLSFELLSPLAILNKKLSIPFMLAVLFMHFSIYVLMYIHFFEVLCGLVFWLPWASYIERISGAAK